MGHIKLTQGRFAIVDNGDFEWLSRYKWHAHKHGNIYYAARRDNTTKSGCKIMMHRQILGFKKSDGKQTDHRNGKGLDNRRENLRACTTAENIRNQKKRKDCKSGFKGVGLHKHRKKWRAYIKYNKKHIHLGYFATQTEAAHAYDKAAIKYFGEFARLNFPVEKA